MQLKQGTLLQGGKYIIERQLGQGGFGITYLAEQSVLNRKVAIKEFFMKGNCERDSDTSHVTVPTQSNRKLVERFLNKFIKEAQTIAAFGHPHIVRIHDIFEENNTAYYVMEYHDYGSLADLVNQHGALPEGAAERYIREVADALDYLHQNQRNHLDVKPANILLDKNGGTVLIDFGLSKNYDEEGCETSTMQVGFSHGYAPLEQYEEKGVSKFSPATDVYSLGATFYKLLTGYTPPKASEILNNGLPPLPENTSPAVRNAIEQAMQPRQSDRPQTIAAFLALLDEAPLAGCVQDDEATIGVVVVSDEAEESVAKENKKEKKSLGGRLFLLLCCCILIVAGAVYLYSGKDKKVAEQPNGQSTEQPAQPSDNEPEEVVAPVENVDMDSSAVVESLPAVEVEKPKPVTPAATKPSVSNASTSDNNKSTSNRTTKNTSSNATNKANAATASNNKSDLQLICEMVNNACPMSLGDTGEFTSVEYKNGYVYFTYTMNEAYMDFDVLQDNPDLIRRNVKLFFTNPQGDVKSLLEMILKENAGLVMIYKGATSGKKVSLKFSTRELREMANSEKITAPIELLESQIETVNLQCPMKIDEGLVIKQISLEDGFIVYNVVMDEALYSIDLLKENEQMLKISLKSEAVSGNDPSVTMLVKMCKDANIGLSYKYIGNKSGEYLVIKIPASEL